MSTKWKWALPLCAIIVTGLACLWLIHLRDDRVQYRVLAATPEQVVADPSLLRYAGRQGRVLYAQHCAVCHGGNMHGNPRLGAPDLSDGVWLYGTGSLYDIERTLLYGIRSGDDQAHNEADMPSFGVRGILDDGQIRSIVQYLLQLNGRPYDVQAANDGRALYAGAGTCPDCHGPDARGNSDYGAPDLTRNVWNSGGDPGALYDAIYSGQHRIMPAWRHSLSLGQIRALAAYVYAESHRE